VEDLVLGLEHGRAPSSVEGHEIGDATDDAVFVPGAYTQQALAVVGKVFSGPRAAKEIEVPLDERQLRVLESSDTGTESPSAARQAWGSYRNRMMLSIAAADMVLAGSLAPGRLGPVRRRLMHLGLLPGNNRRMAAGLPRPRVGLNRCAGRQRCESLHT
jgi:hypothetical protein